MACCPNSLIERKQALYFSPRDNFLFISRDDQMGNIFFAPFDYTAQTVSRDLEYNIVWYPIKIFYVFKTFYCYTFCFFQEKGLVLPSWECMEILC